MPPNMDIAQPSRSPISFSVFELDSCARELRKRGVRVKLQQQPLQILQALLERPGEVITRQELQRKIWPSDTFVDFDHGLYNAIKKLREALGDTAGTPRFIETLPKHGYRFIGSANGNGVATSLNEKKVTAAPELWRCRLTNGVTTVIAFALGLVLASNAARLQDRLIGSGNVPSIRSLAVLPLQNLSGDPSQEQFTDGITEELITEFSGISGLKVISHTSTARYKKTEKSLPEIARELNVDAIVEGSVIRSDNRVRITAQLVYAPQDKNIWAQSYQREFQDSLTLQREMASGIVQEIRAQVVPKEKLPLQTARPVNLKALDAYFQGNYHFSRFGTGSGLGEAEKAIERYRQAIAEDRSFAQAYVRIADVYDHEADLLSATQIAPLERASAEKALAIDPDLAEAHVHLGSVKMRLDWDWLGAEREFRTALQLNPYSAIAHEAFGDYLDTVGRLREGMNEHERAQELDPANDHMSNAFYRTRQYDRGIELLREHLELHPNDGASHFLISEYYAENGMYKESIEHLRSAASLFGYPETADSLDRAYARYGYKEAIQEFVKAAEKLYIQQHYPALKIARFYARLGDQDQVFKWLDKSFEEHLAIDSSNPCWDPLRSDPRFKGLLGREGLPQ